jgi:hypothetical protein
MKTINDIMFSQYNNLNLLYSTICTIIIFGGRQLV